MNGSLLNFEVWGDERWRGQFQPMSSLQELVPGYYDLNEGISLAKGLLNWGGEGRGCSSGAGWFVVDDSAYVAGSLTVFDARFEFRCGPAGTPALRGKIHWRIDDPAQAPGPQNPPPAGLWAPPPGSVPASGDFFYVESDPGDFIGMGETHLFTRSNSTLNAATMVDGFLVGAQDGTESFTVHFDRMVSIPRLQVGYYPNVQRVLLHNPTVAGLEVGGNSRGCTEVDGWFVIDSITHSGDTVTSIDARFEQHCNNNQAAAIRGRVRWTQP